MAEGGELARGGEACAQGSDDMGEGLVGGDRGGGTGQIPAKAQGAIWGESVGACRGVAIDVVWLVWR